MPGPSYADLEWLPPPAIGAVPLDRLGQGFVERTLPGPAQRGDLGDVDGVATVVAEAVGDVLDEVLVTSDQTEELVDEYAVGRLVPGSDVVDLAGHAVAEREVHA